MKAARLYENEPHLRVEEIDEPTPKKGEVVVDVSATGLCRTDLKIVHGFLRPKALPHTPGHEIAGKVTGSAPSNEREEAIVDKVSEGKCVLVHPYVICGRCSYCLTNRGNLCKSVHRLGFDLPGGFAEYVKAPIQNLVPTKLGPEAAVLTDAGATIWHAFKKIELRPGMRIAVMGVGGLGSFAVQVSKLQGAEVIALDVKEDKLAFAEELGADITINLSKSNPQKVREEVAARTGGELTNVFVDLVGTEESQRYSIPLLRAGGKLLQIGYSPAAYANVLLKDVVYNEIELFGSLASTINDLREIVELVEAGKVKLDVTDRYPLRGINDALEDLEKNQIRGRAIVQP